RRDGGIRERSLDGAQETGRDTGAACGFPKVVALALTHASQLRAEGAIRFDDSGPRSSRCGPAGARIAADGVRAAAAVAVAAVFVAPAFVGVWARSAGRAARHAVGYIAGFTAGLAGRLILQLAADAWHIATLHFA